MNFHKYHDCLCRTQYTDIMVFYILYGIIRNQFFFIISLSRRFSCKALFVSVFFNVFLYISPSKNIGRLMRVDLLALVSGISYLSQAEEVLFMETSSISPHCPGRMFVLSRASERRSSVLLQCTRHFLLFQFRRQFQ